MGNRSIIKVFLASPNDLAAERIAFKEQLDELNLGFGDGANVQFIPLGWEYAPASTGPRVQAVINADVDQCDIFILALNRRWGQPAPDSKYSSYTEEEFHRALARWKDSHVPIIFVFFKDIDADSLADPGEQLKKVLAFRRELEESRCVLYRRFGDVKEFKSEVDQHLRRFAKGELPKVLEIQKIILPLEYVRSVEDAEKKAKQEADRAEAANRRAEAETARAKHLALALASRAAQASKDGRIEEAREDFAKASRDTNDNQILHLAFEFYFSTGDFRQAEELLSRMLAVSGAVSNSASVAAVYGNLGLIHYARRSLDKAEELFSKSLAINKRLGRTDGIADQYNNLGLIFRSRGDLTKALEMFSLALALNESISRDKGIALQCGNLGNIYLDQGENDKAEKFYRRALAFAEQLGDLDEIAREKGHLANIRREMGDLREAEALYLEALSLAAKRGLAERMAQQYSGLGNIYQTQGKLDKAEEMYKNALGIDENLGRLEGIASQHNNLALVYIARDKLDLAEQALHKAMAIDEKLGNLEGLAAGYGNLGIIFSKRGSHDEDMAKIEEMFSKALSLYEKIGLRAGIATQYCHLGGVYSQLGKLDKAEQALRTALDIALQINLISLTAVTYGSLGIVFQAKEQLSEAEKMHIEAIIANEKTGRREGLAIQRSNLGNVYYKQGLWRKARDQWQQAVEIFLELNNQQMAAEIRKRISELPS